MNIKKTIIIIAMINSFYSLANSGNSQDDIENRFNNITLEKKDTNKNVFNEIKNINLDVENEKELKYINYKDIGELHSCTSWTPLKKEVRLGYKFRQNRICYQNKILKDEIEDEKLEKNLSIAITQTQKSIGNLDYIKEVIYGDWTNWYEENGFMKKSQTTSFLWASGKVQHVKPNIQSYRIEND